MRTIVCSLVLVLACVLLGCGPSRAKVNGKIVKGSEPYTLSDKGVFVLSFIPESGGGGKAYNATTKPDGTFTIVGPEGKGIPAGKYKVNLQAMDPYGGPDSKDKLGGKYVGEKSSLVVDVGRTDLTIDVGK